MELCFSCFFQACKLKRLIFISENCFRIFAIPELTNCKVNWFIKQVLFEI